VGRSWIEVPLSYAELVRLQQALDDQTRKNVEMKVGKTMHNTKSTRPIATLSAAFAWEE